MSSKHGFLEGSFLPGVIISDAIFTFKGPRKYSESIRYNCTAFCNMDIRYIHLNGESLNCSISSAWNKFPETNKLYKNM